MKTYKAMTLGDLIERLRSLPENAKVRGLELDLHSSRGSYDETAITPGGEWAAVDLVWYLEDEIGTTMYGWKGGEYTVRTDLPVWYEEYGVWDHTRIIGIEIKSDGVYEPVLLKGTYR